MRWAVDLSRGAIARRNSEFDVFVPRLRRCTARHQPSSTGPLKLPPSPVEYKDVTTTWKGLSRVQAEEIIFWEAALKAALETYVANVLQRSFMDTYPNAGELGVSLD